MLKRCPKCHGNLLPEEYSSTRVLYCLACSIRGTYEEMNKKIVEINKVIDESSSEKKPSYNHRRIK